MKRKFLIDGNHLCGRCASTMDELVTSKGQKSGVILGFIRSMLWAKNQNRMEIEDVVVCWDFGRAAWRMELWPDYKAGRAPAEPTPQDIADREAYIAQIQAIQYVLPHMGVRQVRSHGVEADDLLGIVSQFYKELNYESVIYSGDHDIHQLVCPQVSVFDAKRGLLGVKEVSDLWNIPIPLIPLHKALTGDSSDNIPGVGGVGDKRATEAVRAYKGVDESGNLLWEFAKESKWTSDLRQRSDIIRRNYKLVRIPRAWEGSGYTPHQAIQATEMLSTPATANDLEFVKFLKMWEVNSLLESYRSF